MKKCHLPYVLWTFVLLFYLTINGLNAQNATPTFEHIHDDHSCGGVCYPVPDSIVQMSVYLPFDSVQSIQSVGVKDGLVYFQGDIILGEYNELASQNKGLGINGFRWTNSTVRYYINGAFSNTQRNNIIKAANEVAAKTDICFEQLSSPSGNYVNVVAGQGCSSFVGMRGGAQALTLSGGCGFTEIIHEFLHAAGMWHEQSRSDRGNHITIHWNNIIDAMKHNFNIQYGSTLYGGYDINSIMHYRSYAFSKNGLATITQLNGATIPYNSIMSSGDINTINSMYNTCGGGGGGGGGGTSCNAPTATENYTTAIAQNTARLYCSTNRTYRQWQYRHGSSNNWTITNYTTNVAYVNVTGLNAGSNYVWQSRVWCGQQWSAWSPTETFTTQAGGGGGNTCATPSAAENSTSGITTSSATLNCSTNYTYKQYQYRSSSSGSWTTTNYTTNTNTKSISSLSPNTAYFWQSRVWCGSTWGAWSGNESFTTNGTGGGGGGGGSCSAASGLYYYGLTATTINLDWSDATGATSYTVYYWAYSQWNAFATVNQSSIYVHSMQPGSTYYFLVSSTCGSTFGGYSNYIGITTPNALNLGAGTQSAHIDPVTLGIPHEKNQVSLDVNDNAVYKENSSPTPPKFVQIDVQISPNPVGTNLPVVLNVETPGKQIHVMITNINGSRLFADTYIIEPGKNEIQLEPIQSAGMYFVTIQSQQETITRKMMVLE